MKSGKIVLLSLLCILATVALSARKSADHRIMPISSSVVKKSERPEDPSPALEASADNESPIQFNGKEEFCFSDLSNQTFWFGSGVGAWSTEVSILPDGSFYGFYHDSDVGDTGEDYPGGTTYWCSFTGTLSDPEKVNNDTYSVTVQTIKQTENSETVEIKDGIRWVCTDPYGFDNANELLIFLPGAPISSLPEAYINWVNMSGNTLNQTLPFYGLYNLNAEEGFSSYPL